MPGRARRLAPEGRTARRRSRALRKGRAAIQGTCRNDLHSGTTYNELATPPASRSPPLSRIFASFIGQDVSDPEHKAQQRRIISFRTQMSLPACRYFLFYSPFSPPSLPNLSTLAIHQRSLSPRQAGAAQAYHSPRCLAFSGFQSEPKQTQIQAPELSCIGETNSACEKSLPQGDPLHTPHLPAAPPSQIEQSRPQASP